MVNSIKKLLTLVAPIILCLSCSSITVKPDIATQDINKELILKAKINYVGNPAYLPKTVVSSTVSDINVTFEYNVIYDGSNLNNEIIAGLMPTTIIGVPTGGDEVTAVAKLEVRNKETLVKSYTAEAQVFRSRSLFMGAADKTEMRLKALMAVKENLEKQLLNDYNLLSNL